MTTSSTPIPDQPPLRTEPYKGDDVRRLIIIPLVQNLIAGLAIGILGWIVLYAFDALETSLIVSVFLGGVAVACVVTVFRFFADDFGFLSWAYRQGGAARQPEIDALKAELGAEKTRHRDTKREKEALEYATHATETKGRYVAAESTEDPAYKDAQTLIDEWARRNYSPPTQRAMAEVGWTPQRYAKALSYLGSKGVIDRNGTKPRWQVDTKAEAVALLEID